MSTLTTGDPNDLLTYTTPSAKMVRGATGEYASGTTLRCDHLADGTALGLPVEGQQTNNINNNSTTGAVAGSSGTLPTSSGIVEVGGASLTRTISLTTVNGVECIGLRYAGTTADTVLTLSFASVALITAASGDVRTLSAFLALTAGNMTNISTFRFAEVERTSGGALVTTQYGSDIKGSLTSTLTRYSLTATLAGGGTVARVQPRIEIAYSSGVAVDFTILIGWPQEELGAHASSPIRTTSAAVTRAADNISIATSLLPFDATKGTLLAKVIPNVVVGVCVAVRLRQDGSNLISLQRSLAVPAAVVTVGGSPVASLTSGTAVVGTAYKSAFSYKADDFAFSMNGGTIQTDTSGSLPTPTELYIGSASANLEGWLQQLIYLPRDMSDAELVAWSTL